MTSYFSTQSIASSLRQSILQLQSELAASQREIATGNHADIGLTLGAQTGESTLLQTAKSHLQTILDTNQTVTVRLDTTQRILGSLQGSAQDLLDSLLQSSGSTSNATILRDSAESDLKGLIAGLNTTLDGDYIFGGTNTGNQPIADYYATGAANKADVNATFLTAFGMAQTNPSVSTISAASFQSFLDTQFAPLFLGPGWQASWSSASSQRRTNQITDSETVNTSVSANSTAFQQLAQAYVMIGDLGIENLNPSAYRTVANKAQAILSSAISNLTDMQASVGLVQTSVNGAATQMSLQMNILSTQIGNLENVNTYEVATRVADLRTQIEASYSLTSQLQTLSLVKFL